MLRMKRRSEELIVSEILGICEKSAGKTKIVYRANLNSLRVDHYLNTMINNGLITKISLGSRIFYKTTNKGLQLKEKVESLQRDIEELHESCSKLRCEQ